MKAIIFDLFGTLVFIEEKTNPYLKAYKRYFSNILTYESFRREAMTKDYDSIYLLGKANGVDLKSLELLDIAVEKEVDSIKLFSEVEDVLSVLSQRLDIYVLSNIATPYIKGYDYSGLGKWVKQAYFSSKLGFMKPDVQVFGSVINDISLENREILMVGDSYRSDYLGAKDFGLNSVWLNRMGVKKKNCIPRLSSLFNLV